MRIAVDMQGALTHGSRVRGIGRYTLSLVAAMAEARGPIDLRLMLNENHGADASVLRDASIATLPRDAISRYRTPPSQEFAESKASPRRLVADSIVRRHVAALAPDAVVFSSCFEMAQPDFSPLDLKTYAAKVKVVILYDLIPIIFEKHYLSNTKIRQRYYQTIETIKSADLILTISEASRRDAVARLGIDPERIFNILAAANQNFRRLDPTPEQRASIQARVGTSRPFVLYAASADMRKNLKGAVTAFAALPEPVRRAHQLLLVSNFDDASRAAITGAAAALRLEPDDVVLTNSVSDDELVSLLNICRALIFPSLYEGFGLPVLEAMQCGTPLVAADNSSIPEIVDRADILFDAANAASAAAALERILTDDGLRKDLAAWGPRRAASFSWERSARLALDAIQTRVEAADDVWPHQQCCEHLDLDAARAEFAETVRKAPACQPHIEEFVDCLLFSVPKFQRGGSRRLLIDVTDCRKSGAWTGIQRVVRKLTAALYQQGCEDHAIPVAVQLDGTKVNAVPDFVTATLGGTSLRSAHEIEIRPGDDLFMLDSNWLAYPTLGHLFARVRRAGGRVTTAVYDLIPELNPEFCDEGMPRAHKRWLHAAIASSDALLCISGTVADQLSRYITENRQPHRSPLEIGWFHCGSDVIRASALNPPQAQVGRAFDAARPTFLSVATLEPRKDHALAIDAFDRLWGMGTDVGLCFLGARGWRCEDIERRIRSHAEFGKRLFWISDAKDTDLVTAYARAEAVLCLSRAEGFGLPIAEAARMNRPAICSDIPVFREVGRDGAIYFRTGDPNSLVETLQGWLAGSRPADPAKVSRSTWDDAATRVRHVLDRNDWSATLR